ncbi:Protein required for ethanol metabolism [Fusarium falciforme]
MASRLFQAYNGALARRPLLVQSATAASLYAVGDVIAQGTPAGIGTDKSWKWDWQRTLRMTAIGGLALGPTMALWHALQDVE